MIMSLPGDTVVKNPPASAADTRDPSLIPEVRKVPRRSKWQSTPVSTGKLRKMG